jgi:sortase A
MRRLRFIQHACLIAGLALVVYAGMMAVYRQLYQHYLAWTTQQDWPAGPHPAAAAPLREGMPVARLEIPRLSLSVVVLEGVGDSTLNVAAGHIPETALPGSAGNVGIAAHRDSFFRALKDIREGDVIRLSTPEGTFDYAVQWTKVVKPSAMDVLDATEVPSLTLVTCYPFRYVGSAPDRFIVRARRIGLSAPPHDGVARLVVKDTAGAVY